MGFFDSGGKSVKFEGVNQGAAGYIVAQFDPATSREVAYVESQVTDYTTKEPKTYKDGNPIMQAEVLLQTDARDPEVDDDDGQRRLYVNKSRMRRAIQKALREAKAADLQPGGMLAIWMTGTEPSAGGGSPAKLFDARYEKPTGSLGVTTTESVAAPESPALPTAVAAPPTAPVAPPAAPAAPPATPAAPAAPSAAPAAPPAAAAPPVAAPPSPPAAPAYTPPAPAAPPQPPAAPAAPAPDSSDDSDELPF